MKADLGVELLKLDFAEGFRENIPWLLISSDEFHVNLPIVCILWDQVKPCINVFAPIVMHQILGQGNCGLLVHLEQTCYLRCRRVSGLRQGSTPSSFSHFCCMGSLLELAITFLLDLTDAAS